MGLQSKIKSTCIENCTPRTHGSFEKLVFDAFSINLVHRAPNWYVRVGASRCNEVERGRRKKSATHAARDTNISSLRLIAEINRGDATARPDGESEKKVNKEDREKLYELLLRTRIVRTFLFSREGVGRFGKNNKFCLSLVSVRSGCKFNSKNSM